MYDWCFRGASHLFVASRSSVMVYSVGSSGKERGVAMDEGGKKRGAAMDEATLGCKPNCAVMADQQFVVARNDVGIPFLNQVCTGILL